MPDDEAQPGPGQSEYDAIEAAVMETVRGRWFLKEYARRNRSADTLVILQALDRLREILEAAEARALPVEAEQEAGSRGRALQRLRHSASRAAGVASSVHDLREDVLRILEERLHAMIDAPPRRPGDVSRPSDERIPDAPSPGSYLM